MLNFLFLFNQLLDIVDKNQFQTHLGSQHVPAFTDLILKKA